MSERVGLEGVLDLSQFTGNLNVYLNGVAKMKGETVTAASDISKSGDGLNIFREIAVGGLRAVGEAAVRYMGQAASAVREFVADSISGALEDEQTLARLNQTIKSTGGVAGVSTSDAQALAESFHVLAGGSDDVVLGLIDIGLSLGTISQDEMPAFIQSSIDLGTKMGSAAEAARLLAFAQEQPTAAIRRLRAANVLYTDSQTAQIKAMEAAGDTAGAFAIIMEQVAKSTAGAAQSNLETINGKLGLFSTTVGEAGEKIFGSLLPAAHALFDSTLGAATPIIDKLSTSFSELITQIISGDAAAGFDSFRQSVADSLGQTAANAVDWGRNIVVSLANGIIDGIGAVIDALASVGNIIAFWLSPGSPPKLLPDLPEWGASAMNEFLGGFADADFGLFRDFSGQFESFIRQMGADIVPQTGLVPLILGGRDAIAEAIAQVREVGAVTDDIVASVTSAFGPAGGALTDYTRALLGSEAANQAVATAQAALNAVTAEYDALLSDVDDSISQIDNAQKDLQDEQRKTFLNAILLDPNASASKKANARLELEKIAAEKRKRDLTTEKKLAVDNAQVTLDAAKEKQTAANAELDRQKALLSIQMEQNKLLKEQADLLAKLASGGGGGGGAKAGGGGKGGAAVPKLGMPGGGLADMMNIDDLKEKLLGKFDELIAPLRTKFEALQTAWKPVGDKLAEIWTGTVQPALETFGKWVEGHKPEIMAFFGGLLTVVATLAGAYATFAIIAQVVAVVGVVLAALVSPIGLLIIGVGLLAAAWAGNWGGIRDTLTDIWTNTIQPAFATIKDWLETTIPAAIQTLSDFWTGTLLPAITTVWEWLDGTLFPFFETLIDLFNAAFTLAITALAGLWENILLPAIKGVWEMLDQKVSPIFKTIGDYLDVTFGPAIKTIKDIISSFVSKELTDLTNIWTGINTGIQDATKWLAGLAEEIGKIKLPDWLTPGSPTPFEMGLRGISSALDEITSARLPDLSTSLRGASTNATAMLAPMSGMITNSSNVVHNQNYNLAEHYNTGPKDSVRSFMNMKARAAG